MNRPFLFEFMDLDWIPDSLMETLHDVLEYALGYPQRGYYDAVVAEIEKLLKQHPFDAVAEMGAGTAPLARRLAARKSAQRRLQINVSDLHPNRLLYQVLEKQFPGVIHAMMDPIDLAQPFPERPNQLIVLSGCFHHIPPGIRSQVLSVLSHHRVAVFEPVEWSVKSVLCNFLIVVPAVLAPILRWKNRLGHERRIIWCWLIPVVPFMMVWDSVVSSLRCWTEKEWREKLTEVGVPRASVQMKRDGALQMIVW